MCVYICVYIYMYIYIYIYIYKYIRHGRVGAAAREQALRGNRSSNTTCLTQVFFKHGECFGKLW